METEYYHRIGKIRNKKIQQDFDAVYDSMKKKAESLGFSHIKIIREHGYVIFYGH